jgi:hypothetical protein
MNLLIGLMCTSMANVREAEGHLVSACLAAQTPPLDSRQFNPPPIPPLTSHPTPHPPRLASTRTSSPS